MPKISFMINGGIGKHLCAVPMIEAYHERYPKDEILVFSGYPEAFMNHPAIWRNLHVTTPYCWDDYIADTDFKIGEPYTKYSYYHENKHLIEVFPEAYGLDVTTKGKRPNLYMTQDEIMQARNIIQQAKGPMVTIQVTGGSNPMQQNVGASNIARNFPIETAKAIVEYLTSKGFSVYQFKLPFEPQIEKAACVNAYMRIQMAIMAMAYAHIGIDSAMMHVAAALNKPALIFWGCTKPQQLGYDTHTHVHQQVCPTPLCGRPVFGLPDQIPGGSWRCPHNMKCMGWAPDIAVGHVKNFIEGLKPAEPAVGSVTAQPCVQCKEENKEVI